MAGDRWESLDSTRDGSFLLRLGGLAVMTTQQHHFPGSETFHETLKPGYECPGRRFGPVQKARLGLGPGVLEIGRSANSPN